MPRHAIVTVLFVSLFLPPSLRAQTSAPEAPSFDALATHVRPGQMIVVHDADGGQTRGKVGSIDGTTLVLHTVVKTRDRSGAEHDDWTTTRSFDRSQVREVRRFDGLGNGVGWGLLAASVPAIASGMFYGALCGNEGGANCGMLVQGVPAAFLAGGAGIGALVDKAIDGNVVVYSRTAAARAVSVAPLLGPGRRGAAVSVRFR